MITGAIVSVLTLYIIANAKAIAPEGPAALSNSNSFHSTGRSPHCSKTATITGSRHNLIAAIAVTFLVGSNR